MAIWIWRWRRTMLEKARWIAHTESPRFARRATTCRKYRMPISGQDRGASMACGLIRERFTRIPMPTAESFSRMTELAHRGHSPVGRRQVIGERGCGDSPRQKMGRKAGTLLGQNFLHKIFARVSPLFLAALVVFICPKFSHAEFSGAQPSAHPGSAVPRDADTHNKTVKRQAASTQFARAVEQQAGGQAQAFRIQAGGFELSPRVSDHAARWRSAGRAACRSRAVYGNGRPLWPQLLPTGGGLLSIFAARISHQPLRARCDAAHGTLAERSVGRFPGGVKNV